jgi:DNA-nicking Smr family endonuclease
VWYERGDMGRRGRAGERPRDARPIAGTFAHTPFAGIAKRVRPAPAPPAPAPPPPARAAAVPVPAGVDDFAAAMAGVVPLERRDARVEPPPTGEARRPTSDEAEALAALSDLVAGGARFDISDTREYVEGAIVGLDPRLLRRLRRGDFAWQAHLDLHGLTAAAARTEVDGFLTAAARAGHRCVLIVHGRGLNSKDQTPVLKERLKSWLARGSAARIVLAFATARPCDGGAGALYVLLRRDRTRRPIRVTEGAKR